MLDAAQDALGDRPLSVLTTAGELVSVDGGAGAAVGRRRRQLGGDGARGRRDAPRRAAHRRRQHDRRHRPDRRRPRRRDRPQRPGAAAGRRARLHRRAAHQPRGDRAARAGPRRLVPGVVGVLRDQRRRPSRPRPPGAGGLRLPDARRPRRHGRVRARAHRPAGVLRRRAARRRRRSTRSRPTCTASSCASSRRRRAGCSAPLAARRARRRWSARAPSSGARSPRAWGGRSPSRRRGARPTARWRPPRRWRALAGARACADRRQGRRRARPRRGRRRAARAVRDARRARRAPPAARRPRRRVVRRRRARGRPPLRAARGDARTAWRSSAWSSSAGC